MPGNLNGEGITLSNLNNAFFWFDNDITWKIEENQWIYLQ